jgi:hypothetical protein
MSPYQAKKIIADKLDELGLPNYKLTVRTVSFSDFARGSEIFVRIVGWEPNSQWTQLKKVAKDNGFCIE